MFPMFIYFFSIFFSFFLVSDDALCFSHNHSKEAKEQRSGVALFA
jgi:hypothetical protein